MSSYRTNDGEFQPKPVDLGTAGLDLFNPPPPDIPTGKARRAASREATLEGLEAGASQAVTVSQHERQAFVDICLAIVEEFGEVTVTDIRVRAVAGGLLRGDESGRSLSWMWMVPRWAGLVPSGRRERSYLKKTHGNLQTVWVKP